MPAPSSTTTQPGSHICTVIICTRNRPEHLHRCLAALRQQRYARLELLVVDNAPDDDRSREVALRWGARYMVSPVLGLSRARNHGMAHGESPLVAYIDDDSIAEPGWLEALLQEFQDPRVAAVAGRTLPTTLETKAEKLFAEMSPQGEERDHRWVVDRSTPDWFAMANFGGIGKGGNMAFRRSTFNGWTGFLPSLGRGARVCGGEECFAFFSLIHRGHRVVYTPAAVTRHPAPRGMAELRARHTRAMSASTAYMTFLLAEADGYRHRVLAYLLGRVRRTPRPWRPRRAPLGANVVSWPTAFAALLAGPFIYLRARWRMGDRLSSAATDPHRPPQAISGRRCMPLPSATLVEADAPLQNVTSNYS
jgi:glycosyltransferase involved in cell wall biosynthesis